MATCRWCGKGGFLQTVNRYGFCPSCDKAIRNRIKGLLQQVKDAAAQAEQAASAAQREAIRPLLSQAMEAVRQLEELRPSVPYFRSSTAEYAKTIAETLDGTAKNPPAAQPSGGKTSAVDNAMAAIWQAETSVGSRREQRRGAAQIPVFPAAVQGFVPAGLAQQTPIVPPPHLPAGADPCPQFGQVLLEQEPENQEDPDTVSLYYAGRHIGSLPAGPLRDQVNASLDQDLPVLARIFQWDGQEGGRLELCFYQSPQKSGFRFVCLEHTADRQVQSQISRTERWEPLSFHWEEASRRYLVHNSRGQTVGALPPREEALLEAGEPTAVFYQANQAADGLYRAIIAILRPRGGFRR